MSTKVSTRAPVAGNLPTSDNDRAALTDEELARKLQDEELVDAQAYEDQQSASDIYFTEGGFNDLKSNTEIADEDFYLAMQLQETELLAEQHRSIQSMQNARSSLSPNYRFEKVTTHRVAVSNFDIAYFEDEEAEEYDEEEDEEEDEDMRYIQSKGVSSNPGKLLGMKPGHMLSKPGGRQSAGKYHQSKAAGSPTGKQQHPSSPVHDLNIIAKTSPASPYKQTRGSFTVNEIDDGDFSAESSAGGSAKKRGWKSKASQRQEVLAPTSEGVLDGRTRLKLQKIQNVGLFDRLDGVVQVGKEASVYHAEGSGGEFAVKIYKTTMAEFKDREKYLGGEWRFRYQDISKLNTHKLIKLWAEKELRNLKRLENHQIPAPRPIAMKGHILIMDFIGKDGRPAPQLQQVSSPDVNWASLYKQCVDIVWGLYQRCKLVHADFSGWNLLLNGKKLVVIDLAQSVENDHPNALYFLRRDCSNVCNLFHRRTSTLPVRALFELVTDKTLYEREAYNKKFEDLMEQVENGSLVPTDDSVFMTSYIPTSLRQVSDPTSEIESLKAGDFTDIYHTTLTGLTADLICSSASSSDESDDEVAANADSKSPDADEAKRKRIERKAARQARKAQRRENKKQVQAEKQQARTSKATSDSM